MSNGKLFSWPPRDGAGTAFGRALALAQNCVGIAFVRLSLRVTVALGVVLSVMLMGLTSVARADFAQKSHRAPVAAPLPTAQATAPHAQVQAIGPTAPVNPLVPAGSAVTEALVAGGPPIPPGQTDDVDDNAKYEPTIARDPVTGHFLASAIDFIVFDHFFNPGSSAVYGQLVVRAARSPDGGATWSAPDTVSDPGAGEAFMPAIGTTGNRVIVSYVNVTASSNIPAPASPA